MIAHLTERFGVSGLTARGEVGPIGVVLSRDALHMVQVARHNRELQIHARTSLPYPDGRDGLATSPKALRRLVQTAMRQGCFRGRRLVTTLPPEDVKLIFFNYTVTAGESEEAALVRVITDRVEDDLADYVVDYLPVREADHHDGARSSLVVLARRDVVLEYLTRFRRAGCEVEALEIGPAAVRRLVVAIRPEDDYRNVLVINFGRAKSYLTVLSGRRLLFDREIAFGEDKLLLRLGSALDMSSASAEKLVHTHGLAPWAGVGGSVGNGARLGVPQTLVEILKPSFLECVDAIQQVLLYTSSETHGQPVEQIYLLGSIAHWAGADRLLNSLIEVPVTVLDPLAAFAAPDAPVIGDGEVSPLLAVATGLALRGMASHA
ncbi:MAG: pilus assembly protein PilM [Nitrospirota bacterium]|jgi:Tfp pilus assembly PilM family ATPase